jgi:hypothetical protein
MALTRPRRDPRAVPHRLPPDIVAHKLTSALCASPRAWTCSTLAPWRVGEFQSDSSLDASLRLGQQQIVAFRHCDRALNLGCFLFQARVLPSPVDLTAIQRAFGCGAGAGCPNRLPRVRARMILSATRRFIQLFQMVIKDGTDARQGSVRSLQTDACMKYPYLT